MRRVSKKTRAERWPVLAALRAHVLARASGRCECVAEGGLWHHGRVEVHHVVKRSRARDDTPDNAVALCQKHHQATDRAFAEGRLVVSALGGERFAFAVVTANDKWATRA
jgi:5-methylcytosine-specific restriction endonuclease McrA